jgi:sugar lactone lactonase YvrE
LHVETKHLETVLFEVKDMTIRVAIIKQLLKFSITNNQYSMSNFILKIFLNATLLVAFAFSSVHPVPVEASVLTPIELPSNFYYPNGITRASNSTLYVGSITNGRILRIKSEGEIETFFPGSDEVFAATALRLDEQRGILWGTSPDFLGVPGSNGETSRRQNRIFAIDTSTGEVLRVILMPDDGFGNDIALDANGGVYLTDSMHPRVYYLAPGAEQLSVWAEDARFGSEEFGLSGIARRPDGITVVGLYSEGELFKITPQPQGDVEVEAITLERKLENPDGIQFTSDGDLLVLEGAVASGDGRLLRINSLSLESGAKSLDTIASGLESPTNLTVAGRNIWVTESRIRRRILPGQEKEQSDPFFIRRFTLLTDTNSLILEPRTSLSLIVISTTIFLLRKRRNVKP